MCADLRSRLKLFKSEKPSTIPTVLYNKGKDIHDIVEGSVSSSEYGNFFLKEKLFELSHVYGEDSFRDVAKTELSFLKQISKDADAELKISDMIFLDTETTGLSGGAGTVAFLIGVGYFTEGNFVLRQYFMRDYDEEFAMLSSINELISQYKAIVSFNGKAFDWNLILSRFVFNKIRAIVKNPIHIDLLYPARKIWKLKLDSCKLSVIEEKILGEERLDDIPGALIPGIYFKYIQDRDANEIKKVLKHNENDILSMVALIGKIGNMLYEPLLKTDMENELLGVGRIYEADNNMFKVVDCYEACLKSDNIRVKNIAAQRLANIYKKCGKIELAVKLWNEILEDTKGLDLNSAIELAKYYEHKTKDFKFAASIIEKNILNCRKLGLKGSRISDLEKRYLRLKGKIVSNH